mmetsp:Transcript_8774/g.15859  ORF Transcript_8774/g.15859 Transcript_8774/m.15859 type:complete len:219 (-) Transcript_8774:713-1369(-)
MLIQPLLIRFEQPDQIGAAGLEWFAGGHKRPGIIIQRHDCHGILTLLRHYRQLIERIPRPGGKLGRFQIAFFRVFVLRGVPVQIPQMDMHAVQGSDDDEGAFLLLLLGIAAVGELGLGHELLQIAFDDVTVQLDSLLQELLQLPVQITNHFFRGFRAAPLAPAARLTLLGAAFLLHDARANIINPPVETILPETTDGIVSMCQLRVFQYDVTQNFAQL